MIGAEGLTSVQGRPEPTTLPGQVSEGREQRQYEDPGTSTHVGAQGLPGPVQEDSRYGSRRMLNPICSHVPALHRKLHRQACPPACRSPELGTGGLPVHGELTPTSVEAGRLPRGFRSRQSRLREGILSERQRADDLGVGVHVARRLELHEMKATGSQPTPTPKM